MVLEEIAQALAIRERPEEAFVLWAAVDATGVQAPSKVGRERRAGPYVAGIAVQQQERWRARGSAMPLDHAISYAQRVVAIVLT